MTKFFSYLYNIEHSLIGNTNDREKIKINDKINIDIEKCKKAWKEGLRNKL